jgi:Mitochondrial K+-H+ exchange-related
METTVYFLPPGEQIPELLLFEEQLVTPGWKRAEQTGRKFRQRVRELYEKYSVDLFAPDRFVRKLVDLKRITVLLRKPLDPSVVRKRLREIVQDRKYHHLRWMIVDILLLPVSLLAVPLPGPNIFGYYLLFRVYSHWKSFRSASRAQFEAVDVEVSSKATEVEDLLRKNSNVKDALMELRNRYGLRALQEERFIPRSVVFKEMWARLRLRLAKSH